MTDETPKKGPYADDPAKGPRRAELAKGDPAETPPAAETPTTPGEKAPTTPGGKKPCEVCGKKVKRMSQHMRRAHGQYQRGPRSGSKRSRSSSKRENIATVGSGLWRLLGVGATQGGNVALGRTLQLQAPNAGPTIDRIAKRVPFLDRLLQPFARVSDDAGAVGGLFGLPAAVLAVQSNPNPLTVQLVRGAFASQLPSIVEALKDAREAEQKMEADLAELAPMLDLPEGQPVDLDVVLTWVFGVDLGEAVDQAQADAAGGSPGPAGDGQQVGEGVGSVTSP